MEVGTVGVEGYLEIYPGRAELNLKEGVGFLPKQRKPILS
jgi:hypothetical protein